MKDLVNSEGIVVIDVRVIDVGQVMGIGAIPKGACIVLFSIEASNEPLFTFQRLLQAKISGDTLLWIVHKLILSIE
eukprot:scaffold8929_cov116-Skeletonema_dohrnii-CCMP3373.AAC.1